jgi:hypothetical protein
MSEMLLSAMQFCSRWGPWALQFAGSVIALRVFSVAMTNPVPQTSRGLLSVDPDVAKTPEVVPLRQTNLGPVSFKF